MAVISESLIDYSYWKKLKCLKCGREFLAVKDCITRICPKCAPEDIEAVRLALEYDKENRETLERLYKKLQHEVIIQGE